MSKDSIARNNMWKWLALLLLAVGSAYLALPVSTKVRLGLDLQGGTQFTLGVDEVRMAEQMKADDPACKTNPDLLSAKMAKALDNCDKDIVRIVRRRIDAMGTNEPLIQPVKGKHRVEVSIPGADEDTRTKARDRLQKMSYLEFRLVSENEQQLIDALDPVQAPAGFIRVEGGYRKADNWDKVVAEVASYAADLAAWGTDAVETAEPVRFVLQRDESDPGLYHPRFVSRQCKVSGKDLRRAEVGMADGFAASYKVNFELTDAGSSKFGALTGENIGRNLAIILDDELVSAPTINAEIRRHGEITGNFKLEEAKRLVSDLNAGALPAPLKIMAESKIDPTVGVDAIERGKWAAIAGFVLVALFMLFYYSYVGLVADVALMLNVVLLPSALFLVATVLNVFVSDPSMAEGGSFQLPVLTMPGIAGLVLTLGMAVDANVLIFERIREEFTRGADVGKAVENGYGRAFTAILDSNITTIITGCILYSVGTGPVRGFAIMLTGGVVISMFTAIVVTRLMIDHTTNPKSGKAFAMRQFFTAPKIDFMKYGRKTLAASLVLIVATVGLFAYRCKTAPSSVLAVDLTGGTKAIYTIAGDKPGIDEIRKTLAPIDSSMFIQSRDNGLQIQTSLQSAAGTTVEVKLADTAKGEEFDNFVKSLGERIRRDIDMNAQFAVENGKLIVKLSETSVSSKGIDLKRKQAKSPAPAIEGCELALGVAIWQDIADHEGTGYFAGVTATEKLGVADTIRKALNDKFTYSEEVTDAEGNKTTVAAPKFALTSLEMIDSAVGEDLRESGTYAVLFSLIAILVYVGFRFRFGFGLGGLVALAHDALISLGLYTLFCHQVSLIVITALLTIVGYSINDTVVVFDRIREQLKHDKRSSFYDICNEAINACLGRTVITSLTTFFAVAALFIFGEGSIYDFALTMLIGVVAGTYSSIFIATPIMFWWYKGKRPDFDEEEEEKNEQA